MSKNKEINAYRIRWSSYRIEWNFFKV